MEDLADRVTAVMLLSLRIAPAFAFSPPFTLLRIPASVRLLLGVALAAWLAAAWPEQTWRSDFLAQGLFIAGAAELFMGIGLALALQLAFAALLTVGRAADIQAGFGLAMLVDPATRAQSPLIGTIFAYAAGIVFFAAGGAHDLLAIWSASVAQVPLGTGVLGGDIGALAAYMTAVFVMAFGAAGMLMLVLFIIDLAIAFMSRTLPQMNVLLMGFQVKTLATLIVLPISMGLSAALFLRMIRFALESAPRLV